MMLKSSLAIIATSTAFRSPSLTFRRCFQSSSRLEAVKTAIVGLPNVGKSTLFNALTETQGAEAANYPFCTIEPNVGIVEVPDPKLKVLEKINESVKVVPATLEFVDVAGLVKGASDGEGLGNKFLANIRECDAIVHVVRCFLDENVIHVDGSIDPLRDVEVIELELILSDLAQVEKRNLKAQKDKKATGDEKSALEKLVKTLESGNPARKADLTEEELKSVKSLGLLTAKRMIYAANVADEDLAGGNEMVDKLKIHAEKEGAKCVIVSAQVESELIEMETGDRIEFLESLGGEERRERGAKRSEAIREEKVGGGRRRERMREKGGGERVWCWLANSSTSTSTSTKN